MADLDDYQLSAGSSSEPPAAEEGPPPLLPPTREGDRSTPPVWTVVAIVATLALAALVYFWFFGRTVQEPAAAPAVAEPATAQIDKGEVEEEALEPIELPSLDASDALVRGLVSQLSSHPTLVRWIANEDLVRRFVAAVDDLAEGQIPRAHLGFIAPKEGFRAMPAGDRKVIDPASFRRFDLATQIFVSIDPQDAAELYRQLEPLVREAYRDLGYPERDFRLTVARAADVVAETPRPSPSLEVLEGVRSFEFADPHLEALLPVQKQLLGFGADNLARIQAQARALVAAVAVD
ncbi:MAG: DUF3014 domain-containing protein [Acidobacteriota bacterium]|nr:DUF3014 domain-containing protein [Acidobacteriota bacterium]